MTHRASYLFVALAACSGSVTSAPPGDAPSADVAPDASADVAPDVAPDAPMCPLPPIDTAACVDVRECTTVARGCYCGQQPVEGVSRGVAAAVEACEVEAARHCALGCVNIPGQRAQDGRSAGDGGVISVRCEQDGGVGRCVTYVR